MCTSDFTPRTFVLALRRADLPTGPLIARVHDRLREPNVEPRGE